MNDFRVGYLYSLAPIHCGGEGDLGNILDIVREVHTDFPYIPGSSLRGGLRWEINSQNTNAADILFGRELGSDGQMGIHQVWFGDARLLWIPMRTMSMNGGRNVFTWVSCHSLIRDHALLAGLDMTEFPENPVGTRAGDYSVADAQLQVSRFSEDQNQAIRLVGNWSKSLNSIQSEWNSNHIVLEDADFQVLMEHSLWTQIRNKIQDEVNENKSGGSAEVFWTDICIPKDTIMYYSWGYKLLKNNPVNNLEHDLLMEVLEGLFQVGGQANVGRGWVQGWVSNNQMPQPKPTSNVASNQLIPVEG